MDITLEQARVFESVARLGTIQRAAAELHRGHSAILYSLKGLEEQTRIQLFNREGYRNRITLEGEIVLKFCRKLLDTRRELEEACHKIKEGWEPSVRLIYDEVVNFNFIGGALFKLTQLQVPTELKILSAHLDEVENLFQSQSADMMVTILPFHKLQVPSHRLPPIHMHLVAHRTHPLSKFRVRLNTEDLNKHTFITIKTAAGAVGLSTESMKFDSYFYVAGFMTKKLAIMNQLGFGWLPDYLIEDELHKGTLTVLKTAIDNKTSLYPKLYHRPQESLGRAAQQLLRYLKQNS